MEMETKEVYEAPAIESIITSEEMEREVHYAGTVQISQPGPGGPVPG